MIITKFADKAFDFVKKNAPTILAMVASVGVAGTVVVTNKMTKKIEEKKVEIFTDDTDVETKAKRVIKEMVPLYLPIVGISAATIGCTIASDFLNKEAQKKLAQGTILLSTLLNVYRNKVKKEIGEEKEEQLYNESLATLPQYSDEEIIIFEPRTQFRFKTTFMNFVNSMYEFTRLVLNCDDTYGTRMADFYSLIPEINSKDIPERAKYYGWNYDMFLDSHEFWLDYDLRPIISDDGKFYELTWDIGPINLEYDDCGPWEKANEQIIFA